MLSGIGIAVLVVVSVAFVAMTGAALVNVVIVGVSGYCRRRGRKKAAADVQPTDLEGTRRE